jgi:glyoxylase-like metal-dependent hydrolase (beta-lactamase superfamily II)
MRELAPDLHLLDGFQYLFNLYLMGDVLVDAGTRYAKRRILRQLKDKPVRALALTHAHPDHQGSAKAVCDALNLEYWCGRGDVRFAERGFIGPGAIKPKRWYFGIEYKLIGGPGHPVDRQLREGDDAGAGFVVIETPGHSRGHISFWREADRTLIVGDAALSQHPFFIYPKGLRLPPDFSGPSPRQNRESVRKLAALKPELICFSHGKPVRDGEAFQRFAASIEK